MCYVNGWHKDDLLYNTCLAVVTYWEAETCGKDPYGGLYVCWNLENKTKQKNEFLQYPG